MTLFQQIIDFDNLYGAMMDVSHGKWAKSEFFNFYLNHEINLIDIQNRLIWHEWRPHDTVDFLVYEPKRREISRPVIEDRIVHHAIMRVLDPIFEKYFNDSSYATRKGRGQLSACKRLQALYRSAIGKYGKDNIYIIKGDFKAFFKTIDRGFCKSMLRRIIKDEETLWLLDLIIDSFHKDGLPIGFLPSQAEANLVATALDYYVTDIMGIGKYYIRYCDDFRIITGSKERAYDILEHIHEFSERAMRQTLSEKKTKIERFKSYDTLCGYRVHPHRLEPKPSTLKRARKRTEKRIREGNWEKVEDSIRATRAYTKHCYRG